MADMAFHLMHKDYLEVQNSNETIITNFCKPIKKLCIFPDTQHSKSISIDMIEDTQYLLYECGIRNTKHQREFK